MRRDASEVTPVTAPVSGPCVPGMHMHTNQCWRSGWMSGHEAAQMEVARLKARVTSLESRLSWSGGSAGPVQGMAGGAGGERANQRGSIHD